MSACLPLAVRRDPWWAVLRADPCAYCRGPGGTVDHIDARGRGGAVADPENLTGSCAACNGAKDDGRLLLFLLGPRGPDCAPGGHGAGSRATT